MYELVFAWWEAILHTKKMSVEDEQYHYSENFESLFIFLWD